MNRKKVPIIMCGMCILPIRMRAYVILESDKDKDLTHIKLFRDDIMAEQIPYPFILYVCMECGWCELYDAD